MRRLTSHDHPDGDTAGHRTVVYVEGAHGEQRARQAEHQTQQQHQQHWPTARGRCHRRPSQRRWAPGDQMTNTAHIPVPGSHTNALSAAPVSMCDANAIYTSSSWNAVLMLKPNWHKKTCMRLAEARQISGPHSPPTGHCRRQYASGANSWLYSKQGCNLWRNWLKLPPFCSRPWQGASSVPNASGRRC